MHDLVFSNPINPNALVASVRDIDPACAVYGDIARSPESVLRVGRRVKAVFAGLAPLNKRIAIRINSLSRTTPGEA